MKWADLSILILWVIFISVWLVKSSSATKTIVRHSSSRPILHKSPAFIGSCLILLGVPHAPYAVTFGSYLWGASTGAHWIGAAFVLAGLLFALWARMRLGRNWSAKVVLKKEHELVTQGPYAWVRHPIYTGVLLMVAGTAIAVGTPASLVGLTLVIWSAWIKLRLEEALMLEQFPDTYPAYQQRVKRLVPLLW